MEVTAYCTCKKCCGRYARGITASGKKAQGKMIAAPKKYSFGTQMYVEGYGWAQVQDRGGAIREAGAMLPKGLKVGTTKIPQRILKYDKIDLLMPSHGEALKWGKQIKNVVVVRQ
jgi:3D (Asp-Asp-Asp) domain-containing protein